MSAKKWADGPYKLLSTPRAALEVQTAKIYSKTELTHSTRASQSLARLKMRQKWR